MTTLGINSSALRHLQLEIGIGDNVLQTQHDDLGFLTTASFVTDLWCECLTIGITFRGAESTLWVPQLQSDHDKFLMDVAAKHFTKKQLIHINLCRIFLQVLTISDLTYHDGKTIHSQYYSGKGDTGWHSIYDWPSITHPTHNYWHTWCLFLQQALGYPSLTHPLSAWHVLPKYLQCLIY